MNGTEMRDRVAVVTGGAAGIGRATALAFARRGAKVVIADVHDPPGEAVAALVRAEGGSATYVHADVSRVSDAERLVAAAVATYGKIDFAFNNAGIEGTLGSTTECTEENWDRTLAINLKGVWACMRCELAQMLRQGGGAIVNMSSVAGLVGFAGLPAYVASKHGVIGLTKTAALECAEKNIRINCVCPGVIHTDMIDRITGKDRAQEAAFTALEPVGRMGTSDEVAEAVVWLCSPAASFVTGHALTIDGGFVAR